MIKLHDRLISHIYKHREYLCFTSINSFSQEASFITTHIHTLSRTILLFCILTGLEYIFYTKGKKNLDGSLIAYLEARMQHEEKRFSCTVKHLTRPQRVREEGPKYLIRKSHKRKLKN